MSYEDILKRHREETNTFSKDKIYFILVSTESELLRELSLRGLTPEDVRSIGGGGYIKKEYVQDFQDLLIRHEEEKHKYTINNIYEVVKYYCWDYELYISLSYDLDSLLTDLIGLTSQEIEDNKEEILRAWRDYKKEFEKINI